MSKTTTVQIPNPGIAAFQTVSAGYGSVSEKDNKLNFVISTKTTPMRVYYYNPETTELYSDQKFRKKQFIQ